MTKLTTPQKEFLLQHFFRHHKYAGWKNIAESLLEFGKTIVAGNDCIWKGGIGNFITLSEAPKDSVDCVVYEFYLESFLQSEWLKEVVSYYDTEMQERITELQKNLDKTINDHIQVMNLLTT